MSIGWYVCLIECFYLAFPQDSTPLLVFVHLDCWQLLLAESVPFVDDLAPGGPEVLLLTLPSLSLPPSSSPTSRLLGTTSLNTTAL